MKTFEMPKMGDMMEEGKILRWIKQEGEQVKKGESLAEVETDKVSIEIEAFASGILRKILVAEGESAPIGASIAYIGSVDEPLPTEAGRSGERKAQARPSPTEAASSPAPARSPAPVAVAAGPAPAAERIFISPLAPTATCARRAIRSLPRSPSST